MTSDPSTQDLCERVVRDDPGEFSVTDVTPTILRYAEERLGRSGGKIIGGRFGSPQEFGTLYDIMGQPGYSGSSLEDVIGGQLGSLPWEFDHLIIYLIDGMGIPTFFRSFKKMSDEINPEFNTMLTTFPSSTPVATTSLLTGAFPLAHGVVADRFYDMETGRMYSVKPYLTENSKDDLPKIMPFPIYFLTSETDPSEYSFGLITAGKSHSQANDRRFLDYFFEDYFSVGGQFVQASGNTQSIEEAWKFTQTYRSRRSSVLLVRLTIDRLAHDSGPESLETVSELRKIFGLIIAFDHKLKRSSPGTNLSMLLADHGHQYVPEGFVPFPTFQKYIDQEFRSYATNQKVLSLYYESLHAQILKSHTDPVLARVKKAGSEFYGYDWDRKSWKPLKPGVIWKFATRQLAPENYGVGYQAGDMMIAFDNFYVGNPPKRADQIGITQFKSTHGGLSPQEMRVPFLFWTT